MKSKINRDDDDTSTQSTPAGPSKNESNSKSSEGDVLVQGERQRLRRPQPDTVPPEIGAIVPGVRKCNWESFVNRFSDTEQVYAVEVLVTGDQLGREMLEEARKRKNSGFFQPAEYEAQSRISRVYTNATWIERIRIQSPALLEIFSRVTGYAWGCQSYTFMRPFQYLHLFHRKFEEELQKLEAEQDDHEAPGVAHLRAYVEFAKQELLPDYQRFRNPTANTRIRFNDLWYLFQPGDLVYVPDKTIKRYLKENVKSYIDWTFSASHQSSMRQNIFRLHEVVIPYADPGALVDKAAERDSFQAYVYYLDHDGSSYGPVCVSFTIPWFETDKDVRDLELYPLQCAPRADELLEEHRKLGGMRTKCGTEWLMTYNGWTLVTDPMGIPITEWCSTGERQIRPEHIDSEVIVDFREAYNSDPRFKNNFEEPGIWESPGSLSKTVNGPDLLTIWSDRSRSKIVSVGCEIIVSGDDVEQSQRNSYLEKDRYLGQHKDPNHIPDGDDLALLPRRVFVYSLKGGKFAPVDVRYMKVVDHRSDGFSRLQLPEGHKRMIQSAVRSHLKKKSAERIIESDPNEHLLTQDFIRGKGRGLILMLHGEPGVGKTATAEAVAQTFKRPLFPISCGSMSNAYLAEERLEEVFRLADLWDCILLLDEADVFLSARTPNDRLERNGLVSVLLRKLEYYNGILFLTTNRIGKIDQAISSRIHIMLHYRRLGKAEIEGVFRINIDRLRQAEEQQSTVSGDRPLLPVESDILQFASDHCDAHPKCRGAWNGRQIRNAFLIAAALARDEAEQQPPDFQPQLRYWHFKQVEKLMAEYAKLRARVLGKDDSKQALLNEERDDDYEEMAEEDVPRAEPRATRSFAAAAPRYQHAHGPHVHVHGQYASEAITSRQVTRDLDFASSYEYGHPPLRSPPQSQSASPWFGASNVPEIRVSGTRRVPVSVENLNWASPDSRSDTQSQNG